MRVLITIFLYSLCATSYAQSDYKQFLNDKGELDPVYTDNAIRDLYQDKLDVDVASSTYLTKDGGSGTYVTGASATVTYANYQNTQSSFGVVDTRRVIFEPNGTNTGNIVFAYQRHQLGTDGDDTFTNVTGATHSNLLFLAASADDTTNSLGYDYSVSNTLGFVLFMVDASDDFRVLYPPSGTGNLSGRWMNIVVCFTKTAY